MKIAVFHPWFYTRGGAEKLVLEWLKRTKFDVDIYTWHYSPKDTFPEYEKFDIHQLLPDRMFSSKMYFGRGAVTGMLGMLKKIPQKYDALLVSEAGIAELVMYRSKMPVNIAYVHTPLRAAHPDDYYYVKNHRLKSPLMRLIYPAMVGAYTLLERPAWHRFDAIAANSKLVLQRVERKGLARKDAARKVIYPGVDLPKIKPKKKRIGNKIRIVYVSRISYAKRQLEAIHAIEVLREQYGISAELYIVGAATKKEYAQRVLDEAKQRDWAHIVTDVTDKEKWDLLQNADIGLFLGWNEDFGIVPLEYAVAGLPVVGAPGGYCEILDAIGYPLAKIKEPSPRLPPDQMTQETASATANTIKRVVKRLDDLKDSAIRAQRKLMEMDLSWDKFATELDKFILEQLNNVKE